MSTAGEQLPDQVFCVFVHLSGQTWLLPNTAVVDVLAFDHIDFHAGSPDWLLGEIDWQGQSLPVIAAEGLHGGQVPNRTNRARLLVVQTLGDALSSAHYVVVAQGYPQLVNVGERAISERSDTDLPPAALRDVSVGNTPAIIPDLRHIESELSAAVATMGMPADLPS